MAEGAEINMSGVEPLAPRHTTADPSNRRGERGQGFHPSTSSLNVATSNRRSQDTGARQRDKVQMRPHRKHQDAIFSQDRQGKRTWKLVSSWLI
jgi:hypothetical protein